MREEKIEEAWISQIHAFTFLGSFYDGRGRIVKEWF
jgi:hypothetical protein